MSHCKRAKVVITHFCQWLVDDKAVLPHNPVRGIKVLEPSSSGMLPPRSRTPTQRVLLHALVKKDDVRGQALFSLGYWAGCRVKDMTHLLMKQIHVGEKSGWLHLDESEEKSRTLDLPNEARRPLYAYLQKRRRDETSPYVFTSQRGARLTEAGLHHWFRTLKSRAHPSEQEFIADISFHHLRDDFVHRAFEAGWTIEEVAYYVGNVTNIGTLALQSPVRYLQVTRSQVKEKLKFLKG